MPRLPLKLAQCLAALLLVVTLGACVGSRGEPFAPELSKSYVLTEDLVLTSYPVSPPGLFQSQRRVAYVMTHVQYDSVKGSYYYDAHPLPNLSEVARGSRVQVEQMFKYSSFDATVRQGKLNFTDPATEEQLTAYVSWRHVGPKLKEVQ